MSRPHTLRGALAIPVLVLASVYFIAGAALTLMGAHPTANTLWPPPGIALAGLLLYGRTLWPGVLIGAFLVSFMAYGSLAAAAGIAAGNTIGSLIGAELVSRFARGTQAFDRPRDVLTFSVL